jgi:integrase/recombinase XerD
MNTLPSDTKRASPPTVVDSAIPFKNNVPLVLESFIANLSSPETAKSYTASVKEFLIFVAPYVRRIEELRREHIVFYKKNLVDKCLAPKTILKKISAISSLCKYLAHEGIIEKDLTFGIRRPKTHNKKETAALTRDEVQRIFEGLKPERYSYKAHRAILGVGFYTGLRSKEIRYLKISSITEVDGHRIIRTKIKGDKPHEVPINPQLWLFLTEHLEKLEELGFPCHQDDYLFPRLKPMENRPISGKSLGELLKRALKNADIHLSDARRYSPHTMRTTVATHLLNEVESPLEDVQKLLGHTNPSTTQRYNKRSKSHHKSPIYQLKY